MCRNVLFAATLVMTLSLAWPSNAQPAAATYPPSGAGSPGELQRQWIPDGLEYRPGEPTFSFHAELGRFYNWSAQDAVLFDDFDPERRAARSAAEHGAIWKPIFRANRPTCHAVSDGPNVAVGTGDLAVPWLEFTARIKTLTGKVTGIRTRSDLVRRCRADGWRIVREHNSPKVIPVADTERVLARANAARWSVQETRRL